MGWGALPWFRYCGTIKRVLIVVLDKIQPIISIPEERIPTQKILLEPPLMLRQ
jgi:hypothetical protein